MFTRNEIGDVVAKPSGSRLPWWQLEEFKPDGGMWSIPATLMRDEHARQAADLMADPGRFVDAMRRAVKEWPKSCESAFATPGLNLRAWLGHAGCYIATGSPEETTRAGWHQLDDGEQYAANAAADQVINEYRREHKPNSGQDLLWETDYA
jgi:hypothetical protein